MNQVEQFLATLAGDIGAGSKVPTVKRVVGSDPAATSEFSLTVPTGAIWKLFAVTVQLVQGATQTPAPVLIIDDGTNELASAPGASAAQSASVTSQYTWAPGMTLSAGAGATRNFAPLPSGLLLPAGWRIRSLTGGIGANSNYGVPAALVAEFA